MPPPDYDCGNNRKESRIVILASTYSTTSPIGAYTITVETR